MLRLKGAAFTDLAAVLEGAPWTARRWAGWESAGSNAVHARSDACSPPHTDYAKNVGETAPEPVRERQRAEVRELIAQLVPGSAPPQQKDEAATAAVAEPEFPKPALPTPL